MRLLIDWISFERKNLRMTKFIVLTKWKNEVAIYSSGKDLEKQICKYGGYLEFVFNNDKLNIPIRCLVSYFLAHC